VTGPSAEEQDGLAAAEEEATPAAEEREPVTASVEQEAIPAAEEREPVPASVEQEAIPAAGGHEAIPVAAEQDSNPPAADRDRNRTRRVRAAVGAAAAVCVVGLGVLLLALLGRPAVSVSSGRALVQVRLSGIGTEVTSVQATGDGRPLALVRRTAGLVPAAGLSAGEAVHVRVSAAPPSWLRWLLGSGVSKSATLRAPSAVPAEQVALAARPGLVTVSFDHPVSVIAYQEAGGPRRVIRLRQATGTARLSVPRNQPGGTLQVAAAAWPWVRVAGRPATIDWVVAPRGGTPVVAADPAPGSMHAALDGTITLNFNEPVAKALGTTRPRLSPAVAGTWSEEGADTLVFTPRGFGFGPGTAVSVSFDRPVTVVGGSTAALTARSYRFAVESASVLRLQQMLAQLHYLPLNFIPSAGVRSPTTFAGELATLDSPLKGSFSWRWPSTPSSLRAQWQPGSPTVMVKGALMAFLAATNRSYNGYTADDETVNQLADASWQALLRAAAADRPDPEPYSYVYVSENLPEKLSLWEDGRVVLTSPTNTGISVEPTALGTYPIYVRYTFNYMTGFNPDGSYYDDPVYWINYFNGGDAVHGFVRASYGFPQSLGCVELPIPTAHAAFNRLAIGDLVTVA
jgi:L,D-transpeptidase catalytic domain/Bacterial Ig-like domain